MLDLLYLALVVAPLAIAAGAMLLMALRALRGRSAAPAEAPAVAPAVAPEPGTLSLQELSALVEGLARPEPPPAPRIRVPPAATKHCPDCAEEILSAARVCKHCRYRFDEPDARRLSA